ncbi:D-alanyl-D-alanine carboxypeptidase/D-alanyl-D-alanine-endopeptidase [Roseovarius amoyensis]|uniref:D-alanyl-D-alanine carboxypeptidase/D-alanyl-D-alanine endopeptidase n=1 Tax=Roseovarius amoyensis TaxID=2211448 RepID=UPI000DBE01E9
MLNHVSRRFFLGGVFAGLAGPGWAGPPAVSLRPRTRPEDFGGRTEPPVSGLIDAAQLGGRVTYAVVDVATGKVLESQGGGLGQPPASVTKVITALYSLDVLGPQFRFETRLLASGPVRDGVVDGDLILAGGGDPTLDTDELADMAARLKEAGVREVRGKFRVWSGALPYQRVIDPSQPEHVSYNPSLSGLNLNYNRVHFEWKRAGQGYSVTMDARSARYRPEVRVARMAVAKRSLPVYTYADRGDHDAWSVASGALGKGGSRWLPVRRPAAYAAEVFATFARAHGIVLTPGRPLGETPGGQILLTHKSAPLSEILRGMLKYSNNLTAELVGLTATARRRGKPAPLAASAREMSAWAQDLLRIPGAHLVDHSGLGEASRLGAASLAHALAQMHADGLLKPLLKPFPMRDSNGKAVPDHPINVAAKTGTLYFVSSLAGYVTAPGSPELAFAILAANTELREGYDRTTGERPPGAYGWNRRAKKLQQGLIERWTRVYGS